MKVYIIFEERSLGEENPYSVRSVFEVWAEQDKAWDRVIELNDERINKDEVVYSITGCSVES